MSYKAIYKACSVVARANVRGLFLGLSEYRFSRKCSQPFDTDPRDQVGVIFSVRVVPVLFFLFLVFFSPTKAKVLGGGLMSLGGGPLPSAIEQQLLCDRSSRNRECINPRAIERFTRLPRTYHDLMICSESYQVQFAVYRRREMVVRDLYVCMVHTQPRRPAVPDVDHAGLLFGCYFGSLSYSGPCVAQSRELSICLGIASVDRS